MTQRLFNLAVVAVMLSGCGQKGPLYLPAEEGLANPASSPSAAPTRIPGAAAVAPTEEAAENSAPPEDDTPETEEKPPYQ